MWPYVKGWSHEFTQSGRAGSEVQGVVEVPAAEPLQIERDRPVPGSPDDLHHGLALGPDVGEAGSGLERHEFLEQVGG